MPEVNVYIHERLGKKKKQHIYHVANLIDGNENFKLYTGRSDLKEGYAYKVNIVDELFEGVAQTDPDKEQDIVEIGKLEREVKKTDLNVKDDKEVSQMSTQPSKADLALIEQYDNNQQMNEVLKKPGGQYLEFNRRDEKQIMQEIRGNVIEEYAYRFRNSKGAMITGISYAGIKSIVERRGGYEIVTPIQEVVTEKEDKYVAVVKVRDKVNDIEGMGWHDEKKIKQSKNGTWEDEFAAQKALSKALRNAYRSIIDEAFIKKVIEKWFETQGK